MELKRVKYKIAVKNLITFYLLLLTWCLFLVSGNVVSQRKGLAVSESNQQTHCLSSWQRKAGVQRGNSQAKIWSFLNLVLINMTEKCSGICANNFRLCKIK